MGENILPGLHWIARLVSLRALDRPGPISHGRFTLSRPRLVAVVAWLCQPAQPSDPAQTHSLLGCAGCATKQPAQLICCLVARCATKATRPVIVAWLRWLRREVRWLPGRGYGRNQATKQPIGLQGSTPMAASRLDFPRQAARVMYDDRLSDDSHHPPAKWREPGNDHDRNEDRCGYRWGGGSGPRQAVARRGDQGEQPAAARHHRRGAGSRTPTTSARPTSSSSSSTAPISRKTATPARTAARTASASTTCSWSAARSPAAG